MSSITILTSKTRLCKTITPDGVLAYGNAYLYDVSEADFDSIIGLSGLLISLEAQAHSCVIRGSLKPHLRGQGKVRRRLETFAPMARGWVWLDFDRLPAPDWLDPVAEPELAALYIIDHLPPEFRDVSFHWQLSSSAGLGTDKIKMHLAFTLDRPIPDLDLKRWAVNWNAEIGEKLIDPALLNPVQIHYTAAPVFEGGASDPVPRRSGLLRGDRDLVALVLPPVPVVEAKPTRVKPAPSAKPTRIKPELLERPEPDFGPVVEVDPTTGKIIDGREERGRDIRFRVYGELVEVHGEAPPLKEFADLSWVRFAEEVELGATASSSNVYTWERWQGLCRSDHPGLGHKIKPGILPGVAPAYPARALLTVDQVGVELERIIREFVTEPLDTVIRITAGAGKSTTAARVFGEELGDRVLHIYVSDHRIGEETRGRFGAGAVVVKGREKAGCRHMEAVDMAVAADVPVKATCCDGCPDRRCCPYLEQFTQKAKIWIFPHAYLTLELDGGIPEPDMIVVDEDALGVLAEVVEFPFSGLVGPLCPELKGWLHDPQGDLRDRFKSRDHIASVLRLRKEVRTQSIKSLIAAKDKRARLRFALPPDRMIEILEAIIAEWDTGLPLRSVRLHGGTVVVRRWRENNLNVPTLFLDATAEEELFRVRWPEIKFHRLDVLRNAKVTQISTAAVGRRGLVSGRSNHNLIAKLQRVIDKKGVVHQHGLVVTYKDAAKLFEVPEGWQVAHFGNIRGTNAYEHASCVVLIGRYMVPEWAVHDLAAALVHGLPVGIDLQPRERVERGFRLPAGSAGVEVQGFVDPVLAAVDRLCLEAEGEQAVDRIRSVRATTTKEIVILSNHPLDLDVDELVRLDDLAEWGKIDRAFDALDGDVMPMAPRWLMARFPGLFGSADTAKRAGTDFRGVGKGVQNALGDTQRRFAPLVLEYRTAGQRGSVTTAAIRPGAEIFLLPEVQEELEHHHDGKEPTLTPEAIGRFIGYTAATHPNETVRAIYRAWIVYAEA